MRGWKKRILAAAMAAVLLVSNWPISSVAAESVQEKISEAENIWSGESANGFESGDGTVSHPYVISTGEQLRYFADKVTNGDTFFDKHIQLSNDIYLNDITDYSEWSKSDCPDNIWQPIEGKFAGTFDGDGHSIIGLCIISETEKVGFFREMSKNSTPTLKNLAFKDIYVVGGSQTGGIVGHAVYLDCINVTVTGKVSGTDSVGGFVGNHSGELSPNRAAGPLNLINCFNYAMVTGNENKVGGFIGEYTNVNLPNNDKLVMNNCQNMGNITGKQLVGGLCGRLINATDSQGAYISKSSNAGSIRGNTFTGGLVGEINSDNKTLEMSQVCNYGNVVADTGTAGGIAGKVLCLWSTSIMKDMYNVGNVSGNIAGGLIGSAGTGTLGYLNIQNFYNLGDISGSSRAYAGIAAASIRGWAGDETIAVNNSYFKTGLPINDEAIKSNNNVSLNEQLFKDADSFVGFDFENVWGMASYGPIFTWQLTEQKCGENAFWSVSGNIDNLTLKISGFGGTFDYDTGESNPWFYKYKIKNVIIGDEITSIGSYFFAYDTNIEFVQIGKSVEKIKDNAFLCCKNISKISIPSKVEYIGDWCFSQSGLEQIEFEGNAPRLFDCTFYGLILKAKYDSETDGWDEAQKTSYGGNLTWVDLYGTFKTNYVKYSDDLFDHSLPGIPSKNEKQYADELYSWAVEYGYEDVLTKDKCKEIVKRDMPSVVAEDEYGTYVTYMYSTAEMMRDILMINSTKKSLIKWEKDDITNAEVKELASILDDANKIIDRYNDYEQDTQRSALSSIFYTVYANELLKKAAGAIVSISGDYFIEDIKEDFNDGDFKRMFDNILERKISLSNLDLKCEGIKEGVLEKIKEEFPKKFTKEACKTLMGKVIEQNKDVNSFVNVYNEISSYANSFNGDSLIAQFGAQSILPLKLLKIYTDLMKEMDNINQGKYFMLQYSLMRYNPDLYDTIIDKDGNVIDMIDSYLVEIDSAFVREQLDNWYNKGGATVQLSDKQKITLMNTASLVLEIQESDPLSMKQKLVSYWYEYEKNGSISKQSELIMNAESEFSIQNESGSLIGYYKDNKFVTDNSEINLHALSGSDLMSMDEETTSQVLYADNNIIIELGATNTYVHILFTDGKYKCVIENTDGEVFLTDTQENVSNTRKYSGLTSKSVVEILEEKSEIINNGQIVPDDSQKQSGSNSGNSSGSGSDSNVIGDSDLNGGSDKDTGEIKDDVSDTKTPEEDIKPDNNKVVKKGDIDETGMYRAISENAAAFAPTKKIKTKKLIIADYVKIKGVKVKVTKIDQKALKNNKIVEVVVIGKNVNEVGKSAFEGATRLRTISFKGKSVSKIDSNAFRNAKNIKTIDLSKQKKLKTIGQNAFRGCKSLKVLKMSVDRLEKIGKDAFKTNCKKFQVIVTSKKKEEYDTIIKKIKKNGVPKIKFK